MKEPMMTTAESAARPQKIPVAILDLRLIVSFPQAGRQLFDFLPGHFI
jgi:hypothetical protein